MTPISHDAGQQREPPRTVLAGQTVCRANKQLPHARLHDLRHLHATTLLLSGVPGHVVAGRLGHADSAITLRVYAHVIRSAEAAAADIFAQAVKAAQELSRPPRNCQVRVPGR